mgnify:CR=1 FL=1
MNSKVLSNEKKISIAVISPFVVLNIQLSLSIIFDLLGTPLEEILQVSSKIIVGALYVYAFFEVAKRVKIKLIYIYLVTIVVYLTNIIIFSHHELTQIKNVINIFFFSLPSFIYALSIRDILVFKSVLVKASIINFVIGTLLTILILLGITSLHDSYSMSLSYYMLLPSILFLDSFIDKFNFKYLLSFIVSVSIIFLIGARGPLLCIAVFYILKTIKNKKTYIYIFNILIFIFGVTILVNIKKISLFLYNKFMLYGINSRTLFLLSRGGVYLSGREIIFDAAVQTIYRNPLIGIGLFGDRYILDGVYVHNIILEILLNFGVAFGGIIILIMNFLIIYKLIVKKHSEYNIFIIWISLGFVKFFYSSSYLTDYSFWIFIGILLNSRLRHSKEQFIEKQDIDLDNISP